MFHTTSAVTNQPLPFGPLEREKHIHMFFRAFQNRCGPSSDSQETHGSKSKLRPPDWKSGEQFSGVAPEMENGCVRLPEKRNEQWTEGPASPDSMLDPVTQIHISARPELQGPQCVPRRIYSISTGHSGTQLFVGVEESSCLCLQCCGPARACTLQGFDCHGRQVFYFERPLRADACCFGCCLMEMRAYTPEKHLIGTVTHRWSVFTPLLEVRDSGGAPTVRIQGACCPCRCSSNQQFQIVSNIGEQMGTIWKKWPGFNAQCNMDHEYFGLEMPQSMESHTKLLLLAATFLLNHVL